MEYAAGLDPPLDAVGLGSWWPSGRVQVLLEYFHNGLDIPWWGTIMIATFCMRVCVFPLVVMAQRNVAILANNTKEMTELQEAMTIARKRGDMLESAIAGQKLQTFMKEKGIKPMRNMLPILGQMPIFVSMFLGLRGLANLPMESMLTGGLSWFSDLTIPDPYYVLPMTASATIWLMIKLGADGAHVDPNSPWSKLLLYGIPSLMFPLTMNFAAAVTFYWTFNNMISLCQARVVRLPACRKLLGIPELVKKPAKQSEGPKKGFRQSIRETIDNFKTQSDIIDRRAHDERVFREIGERKPKRTYRFDPTKPRKK